MKQSPLSTVRHEASGTRGGGMSGSYGTNRAPRRR